MKEMALRSRIAVLVVAALLSVSGISASTAFLAADSAEAAPTHTCIKLGTTYYCQPIYR
jgi:hypothetical protein